MDIVLVLARTLHIGSTMLLVALPFFTLAIFQPAQNENEAGITSSFGRTVHRWMWGAFLSALLSGALWLWQVVVQMDEQSLWPTTAEFITVLRETQFGQLWLGRMGLGLLLGVVLLPARDKAPLGSRKGPWDWVVLLLGSLLLITLAWAGHAGSGVHHRAIHLVNDVLHLLVGSAWPMGLLPLGLFLRTSLSRRVEASQPSVIGTLKTFSRISLIAVLLLIATGLINACMMIPTWHALFTTSYGQLLLAKVFLVLLMIGLGAINRLYLLPRLSEKSSLLHNLRSTIVAESCLAAAIFFIVGVMGTTPPPS